MKRFGEILSDDFLNTNPDATLVDKAGFLKQIAPPAKVGSLACHDVNVRVMGDFAIIHARTSYALPDGRTKRPLYGHLGPPTANGCALRPRWRATDDRLRGAGHPGCDASVEKHAAAAELTAPKNAAICGCSSRTTVHMWPEMTN